MASNVLPLFWHLASSSKDTRLGASADLVSSISSFQDAFAAASSSRATGNDSDEEEDDEEDEDEDEEDDDDDDDDESGVEVDDSDDEDGSARAAASSKADARLDKQLIKNNAPDVVYTVRRLVRGLGSSRESSRLGFAVALTELLARTPSVTAAQVLSLLIRDSQYNTGMKGSDERDMMFARLFGLVALIDSGVMFSAAARIDDFTTTVDSLRELENGKAWISEAAGWALHRAAEGLLNSEVEWKEGGIAYLTDAVYEDNVWTPEKIALTILLQDRCPELDWKTLVAPMFKHTPLLASQNLVTLGRVLKEGGAGDDDEASKNTGSYKPQLHFVWNVIFDTYFADGTDSAPAGVAPFADLFRVVVDEALFANTSSAERKYWGFQVFGRALPLLPSDQVPLAFTPNFMRSWMNNLSSPDRHLHKAALAAARAVQGLVQANPAVGFALLSQLIGKHGRPDFDRVTKTKTVETIMANLNTDGVEAYVAYLERQVLAGDGDASDAAALEDRRVWALDQLVALCRNAAVPKNDAWLSRVLDFLLVHGFFIVRKADKKSKILALHAVPKPAFSEATAAATRSRFASALVEVTSAAIPKDKDASRIQGTDSAGKLWLERALDTITVLESNKNVEIVSDADDEIKRIRSDARAVLATLRSQSAEPEIARGAEILVSFLLLQTYDEVEDALDMLEEAVGAAKSLFDKPKVVKKKGRTSDPTPIVATEDDVPPMDALLDVLVALLDKSSADLRTLANLVFGLVSPALTASSVQHLVAQLEQSGVAAEAEEEEKDSEEDEEEEDAEDDDEDESDDEIEVDESDDDDAAVDPEFRKRVAEALQVSGLAVDNGDDDESDAESEVWDDEQMMKVDEQLAAVFRQQATAGKRSDLKHAATETLHFKNRILDFFDAYARKQSSNPLALDLVLPLLRVVRSPGELANKAAGIFRTRFAKAAHAPSPAVVDAAHAASILTEIHQLARRATSAEFSALCSAASLFVARASPASALEAYRETLADFMTRKSSAVHPSFISEYVRRHPARAWGLASALAGYVAPGGTGVNAYRQTQGYTMLGELAKQLPALVRADEVQTADAEATVKRIFNDVYDTLEGAAREGAGSEWKADRLKEVAKFALSLARAAKALAPERVGVIADVSRLAATQEAVSAGARTKDMKGVHALLQQLGAVLGASKKEGKKAKANGKKAAAADGDVEMADAAEAEEVKPSPKKRKAAAPAAGDKKSKGKKAKAVKA